VTTLNMTVFYGDVAGYGRIGWLMKLEKQIAALNLCTCGSLFHSWKGSPTREAEWLARNEPVALDGREELLVALIDELAALEPLTSHRYNHVIRNYARRGLPLSKSQCSTPTSVSAPLAG
jgi:hypothetical protein